MSKPASTYAFDWSDLAFGSKKPLRELKATFIMAPRELSAKRFAQIAQDYLPAGDVVLGLSKEAYVLGLDGQPQFKMLDLGTVQKIVDTINAAPLKHKMYTLAYSQRDIRFVLEKLSFARLVLVNGSWYRAFHFRPEYYVLASNHIPYTMISPFADEQEARAYDERLQTLLPPSPQNGAYTELEMLELASEAAKRSFDFGGFQTGVALGRKQGQKYELLATAHNKVVPFETYAMHYGASREKNFSPMNDLNHYDTIHAEIALMLAAQKQGLDLQGSTLFINLLPCPTCARMFTETDIADFVYREDHTEGYAVQLLEKAGKKVRRVVPVVSETKRG